MAESVPVVSTVDARDEGEAAHFMASEIFRGQTVDQLTDRKAPNGYMMTDDMVSHVSEFVSSLDCGEMDVNTSFEINGHKITGRCNHRKFDPETGVLTIDEFKYGHRIVEPKNNWTLIAHAIGTCQGLNIRPEKIIFRIHQPRAYHPDGILREWSIGRDTLILLRKILQKRFDTIDNRVLETGPECAKCHALATCPAAHKASMNAIDASDIVFDDAMDADNVSYQLTLLRQASSVIENRLKAVEELASYRIKSGDIVPGYSLQTRYGHSRFVKGLSADALTAVSGVDVSKISLCTPNEAKRRGFPEELLETLTERPMIGVKLIKRDANDRAEKIFKRQERWPHGS